MIFFSRIGKQAIWEMDFFSKLESVLNKSCDFSCLIKNLNKSITDWRQTFLCECWIFFAILIWFSKNIIAFWKGITNTNKSPPKKTICASIYFSPTINIFHALSLWRLLHAEQVNAVILACLEHLMECMTPLELQKYFLAACSEVRN